MPGMPGMRYPGVAFGMGHPGKMRWLLYVDWGALLFRDAALYCFSRCSSHVRSAVAGDTCSSYGAWPTTAASTEPPNNKVRAIYPVGFPLEQSLEGFSILGSLANKLDLIAFPSGARSRQLCWKRAPVWETVWSGLLPSCRIL